MRLRQPLVLLVPLLGALGLLASPAALSAPDAGAVPAAASARDAAPRLRVSRPTPVYGLPLVRARVLFVLKPGQEVRVLAGGLQIGAAALSPAARPGGTDFYDPDLSSDVVDHVSEGYTVVFHDIRGYGAGAAAGGPGSPAPAAARGATPAPDCGAPPTDGCAGPALREPDNSGIWIQVLSPDGTTRGWVLVPTRRAARP